MKDFIGGVVPEQMDCSRIELFDRVHTLPTAKDAKHGDTAVTTGMGASSLRERGKCSV